MQLNIKTAQIFLIFIAAALVIILPIYFYYAGSEDIYFISKESLEIHPLPHFVNPLKEDTGRALDALEYLKKNPDNKDFFTEVPESISFESISFENGSCNLVISFGIPDAALGSFHESRMLLTVFKTIKSINPSVKTFRIKVEGENNPFNHISTDFLMKLENDNIIVTN
jgi:hypothetical protein